MHRTVPFFLFFLSGLSSLVYEVVWSRMLVLVFGNTTLATGIILCSFMAGLSLGSYIWGRLARTWKRSCLTLFGLLEVFTGLYALAFPLLLRAAEPLEIWLTADAPLGHYPLAVIRGLFCFSLILVPTFLMGGTLPVIGKHLIPDRRGLGRDTALLYGLNTAGAVLGAAATGFLLMRVFGSSGSYTLAAVVNLLAGTIALLTGRGALRAEERSNDLPAPPPSVPGHSRSTVFLVTLGLGISGFCGLGYEVLWTRLLILVVDNSVYSFTLILVGFLLGIAMGSLMLAPVMEKLEHPVALFGLVQIGMGLLAYLFPFTIRIGTVQGTVPYYAFLFQGVFVMVLLPAVLMGTTLPLAVRIRRGEVARSLGFLYAFNTAGGVLGALAAGFILIPFLGYQKSSLLLPALNWIIGGVLLASAIKGVRRVVLTGSLAGLLSLGLLLTPGDLFQRMHSRLVPEGRLVYYREGLAATAAIFDQPGGERILYLNGIPQVRTDKTSLKTFRMMGALPFLLRERRSPALAITFGAGITAWTMTHFVERPDCVELVEEAREIADHFAAENGRILQHDKAALYINDARHFLLTTRKKYGVIVADATHPRGYDSWVLFTREFYELVKERLEPEGVFSQWVPLHGLNLEQYMAIVRTFWTAFPNTSIWTVDKAHTILLGSLSQGKTDFQGLVRRISPGRVKEHLKPVGLADPFVLLSYFSMGERGTRKMLEGFPDLITDDCPRHLFFPVSATFGEQYGQWPEENYSHLEKYQEPVVPYLANLGSTENQVRNTLNRIQMYQRGSSIAEGRQ